MNSPSNSLIHTPFKWSEQNGSIHLFSSLSMMRNLENALFPDKLNPEKEKQVLGILKEKAQQSMKKVVDVPVATLSAQERGYLSEQLFLPVDLQKAHPGESIAAVPQSSRMVFLNIQDHLHFFEISASSNLETLFKGVSSWEHSFSQLLPYAFSERFGFLTADPKNAGTALRARIFLHLPLLVRSGLLPTLLTKLQDEAVVVRGGFGESAEGEWIGDLICIENRYTLGVTEENILSGVQHLASKLVAEEVEGRKKVHQEDAAELKDKVSRAFAILRHSYLVEAVEVLNALSLVKLGVILGWINGVNIAGVNELMTGARRYHLNQHFSEEIQPEQLAHKRAEFLHQALGSAELTI